MQMPVLFIGHGSPMNIIETNPWTESWSELGARLPKPQAILMISAHWYITETSLQTHPSPPMIYDMYGFPDALYQYIYPAKTSPELISRIRELLEPVMTLALDDARGYDHGGYSVLSKLYPEADVPVVQLSIDRRLNAKQWFTIGQVLAALRDEGVLIIASGNIVHNLRAINPQLGNKAYDSCQAFDEEITHLLQQFTNVDVSIREAALKRLLDWEALEGAELAAASPDHLAPFYYALGAALGLTSYTERQERGVEVFCQDYLWGSLSMTSYLWN